ncbi:MAG: TonB family protein [Candidatus Eisenbacteria bacterium]
MKRGVLGGRGSLTPFVAASALIHFVLLATLPLSLFGLGKKRHVHEDVEPTALMVLRVMEIATESLLITDFTLNPVEKPQLPPEESLDGTVELLEPFQSLPVLPSEIGLSPGHTQGEAPGKAVRDRYTPPVPVIVVWPRYPSSASRRNIRGTVVIRVHVTTAGIVDGADVVSGLEDRALRRAALEAAMGLRFLPALLDGKPIDAWFAYPVEFGKRK